MGIGDGFRRLFRIGGITGEPDRTHRVHREHQAHGTDRLDRAEQELDEELDFHFRQTVEELMGEGMGRDEAEREAHRRFGDEARHRRAMLEEERRHRERRRRAAPFTALVFDLTGAARRIVRSPGFAAAVVATLALGIGANVTMFTIVDRLLLSPPDHVRDADRVRRLYVDRITWTGERAVGPTLTYLDYVDLSEAEAYGGLAAYHGRRVVLGGGAEAREIAATLASHTLFPVLGVEPALGRFFGPDEDAPGAAGTAVLGHGFWTREMGADPDVLGTELRLGEGRYRVVGVAPEGFTGAELRPVDVFLPLDVAAGLELGDDYRDSRGWWILGVIGRLAEGVEPDAADQELTALYRAGREGAGVPEPDSDLLTSSLVAADRPGDLTDDSVAVSRWLAGVSLLVLLIACANVANLLLARAVRLRRELAVRVALGVSRGRLTQQLLLESLLLAAAAGLLALLIAQHGGAFLRDVLLPEVSFERVVGLRLVAFTGLAAAVATLLAGALPAWWTAREGVAETLKEGGRGMTGAGAGLRKALLVFQGAFSVLLLVGAGLFVESLDRLRGRDLGMDPERVLEVRLEPESGAWSAEERRASLERLRLALARTPGVEAVGLSAVRPLQTVYQTSVDLPGRDTLPIGAGDGPYVFGVGPGYLDAMGIDLLRGRDFGDADAAQGAPRVAVVSDAMARALWPGEEALGQCMYVGRDEDEPGVCSTVVGVVEDHPLSSASEVEAQLLYYVPAGTPPFASGATLAVARVPDDAREHIAAIHRVARDVAPGIRFAQVRPLVDEVAADFRSWSLGATLFSVFGLLALLVAAIGLYSVLSFEVAQRRHELGIRATLGAATADLVRLVAREVLGVLLLGLAAGLAAAAFLAPWIEPLLFEVGARDPGVYVAVAAVLVTVAVAATALPTLRALRVEPSEALRVE